MSPTECNYNRWIVRLIAPAEKKLGGNKRCLHLAMYCNTFYWHCINHIIVLKKNSKQYRMIMGKTISLSMSHKNFICSCHGIKFNHIITGWFINRKLKKEIGSYHALSHNMEMSMRNCEFFIWWILTELNKWCCVSISIHAAQHTQTTNKLRPSEPISVNNRSDLHQIINENVLNPDGGNAINILLK